MMGDETCESCVYCHSELDDTVYVCNYWFKSVSDNAFCIMFDNGEKPRSEHK